MAGFQSIVDIQQNMTVANRRMVGQQVARSGFITVAQYLTVVPWVFTIQPHAYLFYPTNRALIHTIDNLDRQTPQTITFASSTLSWFTAYQGDAPNPSTMTLAATPATNSQILSIGNLPAIGSTQFLFKAGDFLQLGAYPYKVTADVLRGSGSTVSVSINRPVIGTPSVGTLTAVANACTFNVVAEKCTTYTLNPMTAGAFIQWDSAFVFREYIVQ